jgi:hypothetical protein
MEEFDIDQKLNDLMYENKSGESNESNELNESQDPHVVVKKKLSELQLRNLARGRKMSLEKRRKRSLIKSAAMLKEKARLNESYDATKKFILQEEEPSAGPTEDPLEDPPEDEEDPQTPPPSPKRIPKQSKRISQHEDPPNYKNEYYQFKLSILKEEQERQRREYEEKTQQDNYLASYGRAPPQVHAFDIARTTLRNKANQAIYDQAYKSIFPNS